MSPTHELPPFRHGPQSIDQPFLPGGGEESLQAPRADVGERAAQVAVEVVPDRPGLCPLRRRRAAARRRSRRADLLVGAVFAARDVPVAGSVPTAKAERDRLHGRGPPGRRRALRRRARPRRQPAAARAASPAHPEGTLVIAGGEGGGRWFGGIDRQLRAVALSPFVGQQLRTLLASENRADLDVLRGLTEDGAVTPVIDRVCTLAEIPAAMHDLEAGRVRGKVVAAI